MKAINTILFILFSLFHGLTLNGQCTPVTDVSYPTNQTVSAPASASFNVVVTGTAPSYQWQYSTNAGSTWNNVPNSSPYSRVTTSNLTINTTSASMSGYQYRCMIGGTCTTTWFTNWVSLTVNSACTPVTDVSYPTNQTVSAPASASFNVVVTGTAPSYQWQYSTNAGSTWNNVPNSSPYSGVTTSNLTINPTSASMSGYQYRCMIGGTCTTTWYTNWVTLTVNSACTPVSITMDPLNHTSIAGSTATFNVIVSGASPILYLWYKNGVQISGANSSTYTTPSLNSSDDGNTYFCVVSNCNNTNHIISKTAGLYLNNSCTAVSISSQPKNQIANVGSVTTFSVIANGTAPFIYSWYKNGSQIANANSSSYSTPSLTSSDDGNIYSCKITNCSSAYIISSENATLTLATGCIGVSISNSLSDQSAKVGEKVTWSASANGTVPFSYQWYKNGSPISGHTNSSYSTPSLTLSDNGNTYYCYITNCSNSKNTLSNTANLSITNNPSLVTINNEVPIFSNSKTFWSGNINQKAITIKICSDGSSATQIIFENNTGISSGNIRFWIASDPYESNTDVSGYFILNDYKYDGNKITAKLTHPKYLQESYKSSRSDAIQIVDYTNPKQPIFSIPIEVYRAPVIMVHGLWGNIDSFSEMENKLDASGFYPPVLTFNIDYYSSNDVSFSKNKNIIPLNLNTLFSILRNQGFSCGKVDIIGHSMGGILSRYYLQSDDYKKRNDIHKLITINTPHSGSPFGNLFFNNSILDINGVFRDIGEIIVKAKFNGSLKNGAVEDLAINSDAMNLLNFTTLNNSVVPSHAIMTSSLIEDEPFTLVTDDQVLYAIYTALAPRLDMDVKSIINYLFDNKLNDLVVSVPSQSGGLPTFATTELFNQFHIGSPSNPFVITEIINALNINPSNNNYFAQNGYTPIVLENPFKSSKSKGSSNLLSGDVNITYPIRNQYFNPGEIPPISIISSNGVSKIVFEAISKFSNVYIKDTILSNGIIKYKIPSDAIGGIKLIALGYDSNNLMGYDTLWINLNQSPKADSISSNQNKIFVQENDSAKVSISAFFKGNKYLISNSDNAHFQIADTSIASLSFSNSINGKKIGSTTLLASYLGQITTIPIIVIPQDPIEKIVTSINPIFLENKKNNSNSLKLFPNPNYGEFTFLCNVKTGEKIKIEVYNSSGEKIYEQNDISSDNIYIKKISIGKVSSGIYYLRVVTQLNILSGKLIIF